MEKHLNMGKYNEELVSQVREGKLAIKNSGTLENLQQLLKYIFPKDSWISNGNCLFYFKGYGKGCYAMQDLTNLPYKSVKEFLEEEFVLPKRWCIKAKNEEEAKLIYPYANQKQGEWNKSGNGGWDVFNSVKYYLNIKDYEYDYSSLKIEPGYTEITFDQFCKYVLKKENNMKEKEIIGYKLIKPEYENASVLICRGAYLREVYDLKVTDDGYAFAVGSSVEKILKEAGVLDIWFEKIYAPEKPVKVFIDMGSFKLKVTKDGIFHNAEDITSYVVDINMFWKNVMQEGNMKFGKNYDCLIPSSNIIIEKSGCEKNQTTLTKWINVYNELLKLKN